MIIAVDALGGDYAPFEIVKGAIKAHEELGVDIALVGRKDLLHVLAGKALNRTGIFIAEATEVIECGEQPMRAVRSKPNSSIVVGMNLVKNGEADAFVSAGSTGAVFCAAMVGLGTVKSMERPAIACFLDTIPSLPGLLIDAGANVECRPGHLLQFAHLGSMYSSNILGIKDPSVALLNNGTEETKGTHLVLESFQLLKKESSLNFIGNIEGHDLLKRKADVIVTDGFTGNVVLKTIEGLSDNFLMSVRQFGHRFSSAFHVKGHDLMRNLGMGSWTKQMDYTEYGGACLLGVNGNVIIAHGRSQSKAIKSAIGLAKETAGKEITKKLTEGIFEQAISH
ncbi:MAG: phosphate acyltransferase PlsX [Chloroflexi bacterium]|nr:phosphate acyltransferase PlsX [Chloroflexota bacterium]